MRRSRIAVIIPAFNEARTIEQVVSQVMQYGSPLVVDDASSDRTGELAEKAGAILVRHEANQGYDAALNSGFAEALKRGFDIGITMDADGQHQASLLPNYISLLRDTVDVVIGVRPSKARIAESIFALITTLRYGIRDPLCGMKGYRMHVYKKLGHFGSYGSVGTELVIFSAKQGYRLAQVDVPIKKRDGASRFGSTIKANLRISKAIILGL